MFGNLFDLDACQGEKVAWHMMSFGSSSDPHGVNWYGDTLRNIGNDISSKVIIPGETYTLTSIPKTLGKIHFNSYFFSDLIPVKI